LQDYLSPRFFSVVRGRFPCGLTRENHRLLPG
jgi:hypothetical protein